MVGWLSRLVRQERRGGHLDPCCLAEMEKVNPEANLLKYKKNICLR